jgi:hypothetical protein
MPLTDRDRPAFAQALAVLAETLGQPMSDLRMEGYFGALRDLDLDDVLHGIERALREETFNVLPTPGKLRTYAKGTSADEAEAAWLTLQETVRRVGFYGRPGLPPALDETVQAVWGGWQGLCRDLPAQTDRTADAFEAHRRRFLAAYRVVQSRQALLPPTGTTGPLRGLLS